MQDVHAERAQREAEAARMAAGLKARSHAEKYFYDPVGWAYTCINWPEGQSLSPYQAETLDALVDQHNVAVRGPHGLGKTMEASIAVLWFACTRELAEVDWKIPTTASVGAQLKNYFWPEIRKWARRLRWEQVGMAPWRRGHELLDLHIKLEHGEAFAMSVADPTAIEGAHATEMLFVYDEAKAIEDPIWDATAGAFSTAGEKGTNAYALAISTPGEPIGRFYEIHSRRPGTESWYVRHVTIEEAIAANRVDAGWVEQQALLWGRESAVFQNRVMGEFATASEDSVIPLAWVELANDRWRFQFGDRVATPRDAKDGTPSIVRRGEKLHTEGVDVARGGEDRSVIALRQGNAILELRRFAYSDDTMALANTVLAIARGHDRPRAIVDVIGVGAGVFDRVREQSYPCSSFVASGATVRTDVTGEFGFTNCLTGDARVTPVGGLRRVYRFWYDGPLFRVQTTSGDEFTATPQHHVLTSAGWRPVQALHPGDHLISPGLGDGRGTDGPDVEGVPPTISQVYRAARQLQVAERVPACLVDFHGDRPAHDVEVVTLDRELDAPHQRPGEQAEQETLLRALLGTGALPCLGSPEKAGATGDPQARRLDTLSPVAREMMGASRGDLLTGSQLVRLADVAQGHSLVADQALDHLLPDTGISGDRQNRLARLVASGQRWGDRSRPTQRGSFCAGPGSVATIGEQPSNDVVADVEWRADVAEGLSGEVATNEVVTVEIIPASGHWVYTLETTTGTYRSASVIHKNCRSAAWWNVREMLDPSSGCDVALPPDDRLTGDLVAPKWRVMAGGRIQIESKDDIKKRLHRSTDDGDAVVMALWESGGSWADLYRDKPAVDENVPQPKRPEPRGRGWGDMGKSDEQLAEERAVREAEWDEQFGTDGDGVVDDVPMPTSTNGGGYFGARSQDDDRPAWSEPEPTPEPSPPPAVVIDEEPEGPLMAELTREGDWLILTTPGGRVARGRTAAEAARGLAETLGVKVEDIRY